MLFLTHFVLIALGILIAVLTVVRRARLLAVAADRTR